MLPAKVEDEQGGAVDVVEKGHAPAQPPPVDVELAGGIVPPDARIARRCGCWPSGGTSVRLRWTGKARVAALSQITRLLFTPMVSVPVIRLSSSPGPPAMSSQPAIWFLGAQLAMMSTGRLRTPSKAATMPRLPAVTSPKPDHQRSPERGPMPQAPTVAPETSTRTVAVLLRAPLVTV